ncbi:hypothetical protein VB713_05330 [Anabaena cylindrica UHCC 0172]|nr:hypothetical protein [Anabaena cylindrica]MEA5550407.1 hypothetical protein [Anabaena cylindrica UHCC 0172]
MKPNKCVGLRCRLTQPTENGQGIVIVNKINPRLPKEIEDLGFT